MQGLSVDLECVEGDKVVIAGVDQHPQALGLALTHIQLLLLQLVVRLLQLCNTTTITITLSVLPSSLSFSLLFHSVFYSFFITFIHN